MLSAKHSGKRRYGAWQNIFLNFIAQSLNFCRQARAAKTKYFAEAFCRQAAATSILPKLFGEKSRSLGGKYYNEFSVFSSNSFAPQNLFFFVIIRNISPKISFFLDKALSFCYININDNVVKNLNLKNIDSKKERRK